MTATFTNTVLIAREPAEVFAYLAAFENVPKWKLSAKLASAHALTLRAGVTAGSASESEKSGHISWDGIRSW